MIRSRIFIFTIAAFLIFNLVNSAVIVVNSQLDDPAANPSISPLTTGGVITLRSAIEYSNFIGSSNTINFNIPNNGPVIIAVGTGTGVIGDPLPEISNSLTINGYSQPRATPAVVSTNSAGFVPANLLIILDGTAVTNGAFQNGLTLIVGSSMSVIEGLVIQNFPFNGIYIQGGNAQRIVGNYIGIGQSGATAKPNGGNGIYILSGVSNVIIGSTALADRNIISGQDSLTGATPVSGAGIFTEGSNIQIIGNFIGTDASGTGSISNRTGVYVFSTTSETPLNNTIKCNTIQNNNGTGSLEGFGVIINGADDNPILSNSIYNNTQSAIVLVNDGNDNLPAPTLTNAIASGSTITVNGTLSSPSNPNATFRIEFFVSSANRAPITEGQTFVGRAIVVTDGSGNAVFNNIRLPSTASPGQFASATATLLNSSGNAVETSPYSLDITIAEGSIASCFSFAIYTKYCNRNDMPCATS